MSEIAPKCQRCGTPLPPDAPEGLCPRCLVALNLATQTDIAGETGPGGTAVNKPPPAPPLPPTEVAKLFPQLEILECLGRGGMGAVYKARQPRLDRLVALKILSPEKKDDPKFAERFEREARALARLNHPNIVAVYDFGETQGNYYLLMEYVDGLTLRQLFHTRKLSPPEALGIVPKICEALQYAHNEGIVHRDIKPENILLDKKGQVKIADFGIAKIIGQAPSEAALTGVRDVVGTPHYMAPEQIEKPATVDHRADIYSLGVVFYEMLTGELPLGKFQPPSRKVQIDVRLDEVVLHALEKEPERRYQRASQVKTALETIAAAPAAAAGTPALAQVKGPAIGLIITGVINWVLFTIVFVIAAFIARNSPLIWLPLLAMALSSFIIYAGLKLMRLERRGAALLASVLAMFVAPGNLVGLAVGIWSLVVLGRREVKEAMAVSSRPLPRPVRIALAGAILILIGTAVRLTLNARTQMPVRTDAPFPVYDVRHQIDQHLHAAQFRWKTTRLELLSDNTGSVWHLSGLRKPSGSGAPTATASVQETLDLMPAGHGRWLARGGKELNEIAFEVTGAGDTATAAGQKESGLGPVVERIIRQDEADAKGFVFFDLETGRSLPPPFALVARSNQGLAFVELTEGLEQWIQANRMDVLVHFESNTWSTMNLRMQEDFIPETTDWGNVTAPMVTNVFARWDTLDRARPAVPMSSQGLSYRDQFERCKAFRTRSNTMGVMQWAGLKTTPPSVNIRYRLVVSSNPKSVKALAESGPLLYFPADRTLGTLYVRNTGANWHYPLSWTDWTEFAPARGKVAIPAGQDVRLDVSPEGAKDLSPLASMTPVDLQAVRFETGSADDPGLEQIGRLTGLKALHATVNQITDIGFAHCANLTNLLDLHLQGAKITDRSAEVISRFSSLEHLCLDFTAISDEGLASLGRLGSLKDLSLMQTRIQGAGLAQLQSLTNLIALYLCGTGTGDAALQELPALPKLERLSLKETRVTDAGLAPLNRFPALHHLDLEKTSVSDAGLAGLSGLKSLEDLLLPDDITDEGIKHLDGLPSLKTLALTRTRATGRCLQFLGHLPNLKTLFLPPDVRDDDLACLSNFPNLEELWIQDSPVTDRGLRHLASLRGLKALRLKDVQATDSGYAVLKELPALERLHLRDRGRTNQFRGGIGDRGLDYVATLSELKHLDLARSRVTDQGVPKLKRLLNLEVLDLSETRVHGDGLAELGGLSRLRQLRFKDNEVSAAGVDALSGLTSLELLQLQRSTIAPADRLRLQAAVPSARLMLAENPSVVEQDPGAAIADAIRTKVGRDLTAVGASYDDLQASVAAPQGSATPFKISYRGLRNFKWGDDTTPAANGEFIMAYIGAGQWQGKLGGMQFTVRVGETDDFALPFVNDPQVIGEWESVDFVANISDFNPGKPNWKGGLYLKSLTFRENGQTAQPWWTWTKGVVMHHGDKTASHYEIHELKGQPYLFFEWKSGDVMVLGKEPKYYVLKKK